MARVALTFDDLPVHSVLPAGFTRAGIATRIVDALRARRSPPVYGFINAKAARGRAWLDRGAQNLAGRRLSCSATTDSPIWTCARHTTSAIEQDIIANEPTLQSLMPDGGWRWFRYPFLNEGDTVAKHRRIVGFLNARGYRVAQVTLSFDDWAYSEPYARCAAIRDQAAIDWLRRRAT